MELIVEIRNRVKLAMQHYQKQSEDFQREAAIIYIRRNKVTLVSRKMMDHLDKMHVLLVMNGSHVALWSPNGSSLKSLVI